MVHVLFAVSGSDYWTFADGTLHSCGYWPEELAVPHQAFTEAGFDVTVATPGGAVPTADVAGFTAAMNGGSDEPGLRFKAYLDNIDAVLSAPAVLEDVDAADYDLIFVPGGHGPMEDLATSDQFGALVRTFHESGKKVAAVCHGPAALLPARDDTGSWLFAGRRVTGFTNEEETQVGFADKAPWLLEDRLSEEGGVFEQSGTAWQHHVVADGHLFTGQNPASSRPLADLLVIELRSEGIPAATTA